MGSLKVRTLYTIGQPTLKIWVDHLVALRVGELAVFRHLGHDIQKILELWVIR